MRRRRQVKIKKGFLKRKIGDKYLVVTTGELSRKGNMFIELNDTASDIWDMLEKGYDRDKIISKLCKKYDAPEEKIQQDVDRLIASMKNAGVFE